jgi:2'-5' RNA ligase
MTPTQTALIVPVPEAEPVVGPLRESLDPSAAWGVPAHVTVLYPFLAPDAIDDEVLAALTATIGATARFDLAFARVDWFGELVLWLAPEPDQPLRELTNAVWQRFPQAPPYGGAHADVIPHLTVGDHAPPEALRAAAQTVSAQLPVSTTVEVVRLIAGTPGEYPWRAIQDFALGAAPDQG